MAKSADRPAKEKKKPKKEKKDKKTSSYKVRYS